MRKLSGMGYELIKHDFTTFDLFGGWGSELDTDVEKVDEWGLRDLAYEIKGCTKGYYVVLNVEADAACVAEFDRRSRINHDVVRHMIVNLDKQ